MATGDAGDGAVRTRQARAASVAKNEGLSAEAHQVGAAVVGAGLGQACGVPIEEVLGGNGQLRVDGEGRGNLVARNEEFLRLGARRRGELGQVQAGLAVADAMHRVEDGLAPVHVVLAGLDAEHRLFADLGAVEHEGVEDFAGRAAVVALGIVGQVRAAQHCIVGAGLAGNAGEGLVAVDEGVRVGTGIVVGLVVPAGGTDPEALVALVDHVQLGQQVDAVGDVGAGTTEVVVAVVVVRRGQHALVCALGANAVVVLHGVVEANRPVRIPGIDLEGLHHGRHAQSGGNGRGEQAPAQVEVGIVLVVHALAPLLVVVATATLSVLPAVSARSRLPGRALPRRTPPADFVRFALQRSSIWINS
ncbi:hypothetical protein D9M68_418360 [compost metagenome]